MKRNKIIYFLFVTFFLCVSRSAIYNHSSVWLLATWLSGLPNRGWLAGFPLPPIFGTFRNGIDNPLIINIQNYSRKNIKDALAQQLLLLIQDFQVFLVIEFCFAIVFSEWPLFSLSISSYDEVVACGSITLQAKTVWGRYSSVDSKKLYRK